VSEPESLREYRRAVARLPELSPEEEFDLVERMARGEQARRMLSEGGLSEVEAHEARNAEIAQDAARKRLTEAGLPLVLSIAEEFRDQGVSVTDLVQAGSIGLTRAVESYVHRPGTRLADQAAPFIRAAMAEEVDAHDGE
jgi:RNA polymerase primary sigma factor